ncbi:MAG: hypothetical protein JXJ04_10925 [Spirochaetales bacterium]|nr:hypothetical protein [Spirochaetales bacterium]
MGKRLQEEYTKSKEAIVKELHGPSLQFILDISEYTHVLIIDEVYAGQDPGEILIFDINDLCDHISSFYINEINLSEAINSGKQMGIPIPEHFLLAGIEIGGKDSTLLRNPGHQGYSANNPSFLLQTNVDSVFQTLRSIIQDFLCKPI